MGVHNQRVCKLLGKSEECRICVEIRGTRKCDTGGMDVIGPPWSLSFEKELKRIETRGSLVKAGAKEKAVAYFLLLLGFPLTRLCSFSVDERSHKMASSLLRCFILLLTIPPHILQPEVPLTLAPSYL